MYAQRGLSDRGQVAAIAAVLTLALVVVALALTQAVVVPEQNEQVEFQHQQEVQQDLRDVRAAVLGSADTGTGQTATVRLGTQYRERIFLQNPEPPQGSLVVEGIGVGSVSNAVAADNRETTDFWKGISRSGYVNSRVRYVPGYNYYEDAPGTGYESSVLYRNRSGEVSTQSGQRFVDGRTLSLAFVEGDRSVSRTGTVTVQPRTVSASDVTVDLRSPNAEPMVLRIPTRLPKSAWDDLLADEYDPSGTDPDAYVRSYSCTAASPGEPCGLLTLKLEPGVTYDVKLSKVGLKGATTEPGVYLTALRDPDPIDEGKTRQFTVQVRDRYNNPVSGHNLRIVQPSVGRVVGPTNAVGEIGAVTDEDGRATFTYQAPLNVPEEGATATLGVVATGIPGEKGRVTYDIGIRNTPDRVDPSRQPPLVTAVNPDETTDAVTDGGGDYVRVNVTRPDGMDTSDYSLDLVNRDRSVTNTLALDQDGLVVGETTAADVYFVGGADNVLVDGGLPATVDMNAVLDQPVDIYVVGPNVYSGDGAGTDLSAFADHYGLADDGEVDENDIVVRAGALGSDFTDADPDTPQDDDHGTIDIVDDVRGTVLLRNGSRLVDTYAYRTDGGEITAVSPASPGGDPDDEFVRLDFDRRTDLDGDDNAVGGTDDDADHTLSLVGDGRRETVGLGPVADRLGDDDGAVRGPVFVVGESVDIPSFASERGVPPDRVFRASELVPDGLADGDLVADSGGVARLRDGPPDEGEVVDERPFEGVRQARIDAVEPINATGSAAVTGLRGATPTVSADEYTRLTFETTTDTSGWTLAVDGGDRTARLDLTPVASVTSDAPGPIYLLGQVDVDGDGDIDADDRTAFAAARGLEPGRVVFASQLAEGAPGFDVFDDDGASLALLDTVGDTVDTYRYGDSPDVRIGPVRPRDATRDGGPADEFVRLDVGRPVDSTGWTLAVDDNDGTVEELGLGTPAARNVLGAGQDLYLVGGDVDRDRFAADRGLDPSQVVRAGTVARDGLADPDVLDDDGATLRLTDARDRPVDAYSYENDALFDPVESDDPSGGIDAADRLTEGDRVTGRIDTADPTDATAADALGATGDGLDDEYVRLSFAVPTDTTGWTLGTSDGANLPLAAVAPQAGLGGPIYVVGDGLDVDDDGDSDARDRRLFADAKGVSEARVYPAGALVENPADAADFLDDGGETLTLRNAGGLAVDRYRYGGDSAAGSGGTLAASLPTADPVSNGDGASEFLRLDLSRPLEGGDLSGWTVSVANRDRGPGEIRLDALTDGGSADTTGQRTVYLVGEGVDPATFAAARDLDTAQVRQVSAVDSRFAGRNVLPDDASTLRLRDAGDTVRDRYDYRGLDATDARIAGVTPRGALGGGSNDEATRLAFPAPTDTTGWTLAVDDGDTTTLALEPIANAAEQGGSVYLVGEGIDPAAFADARGVSEARVVPVAALTDDLDDPDDVFADTGATLTLRDANGVRVDEYTYDDATDEADDGTAAIAAVTPAADADANDELVDLSVTGDVPVEDGWTVRFEDRAGDTVATADLSGSEAAFGAPGRTLLVGDLTNDGTVDDADRQAAAERTGVAPDRVLLLPEIGTTTAGDGNFLADAGGRVVLRDGTGATVDTYAYDSAGTAGVTSVEPTIADEPGAEFARLDFAGPVDTDTGQGWQVLVRSEADGPGFDPAEATTYDLSGTRVDDAASTGGPVYLVGEEIDVTAFADARGVSEGRVFRFSALRASGPDDGDALPDLGGELLLRNGETPRQTVDSAAWTGAGGGAIGDVGADLDGDLAADGDADDRLRLDFPGGTDVSDWTVVLDDANPTGGPGPVTLSLSDAAVDEVARAGDSVYVVGDYNEDGSITTADADDYAATTAGVGADQVFTTEELGAPEEAEVLADTGGTVTLRDAAGEAADTVVYGTELRSGRFTEVVPMDATGAAGDVSSDEFVRLAFDRPTDTTGYEVTVRRPVAGDTVAVPLDGVADIVGDSGGPIYLVGDTVDVDAFAAERHVSTDRVLVVDGSGGLLGGLPESDVFEDDGAELLLRGDLNGDAGETGGDGAETILDRYGYGTEQPRTGDWEHVFTGDTEDDTAYRDRDDAGQYVDTDDDADWFDSPAKPGENPTPGSDTVTVESVETTGRDVDGDGDTESTGLRIDLSNGDQEVRMVGFATTTDLATGVDDGGEREADVPVISTASGAQDGFANDPETGPDGTFAADGTVYRFEDGGSDYDGQNAVVPVDGTFSVAVEEYRTSDGSVADLGTLVRSRPVEADLSMTLVFDDGSRETVYLKQQPADLDVTTAAGKRVVADGGTVTFTTTVENRGPGDAPGPIRLTDEYDADQLTLVSASPGVGSYDPGAGTWELPDGLAAGAERTLTVTFRADGEVGDSLPYTVARTASGAPDDNADNDVSTDAVSIGGADLALEMTSPADGNDDGVVAAEAGAEVQFDLTVTNDGPADAPGPIQVTDQLPDGLTYVSSSGDGSYDPDTGVWTLPGVPKGESVQHTITATVSAEAENVAEITNAGSAGDPDLSNNADSIQVVSGACTTFADPGETVLLYSTFETDGSDDADRLDNAGWTASSPGVGGVDSATSAPPATSECDQSAYHADGGSPEGGDGAAITSPEVDTRGYGLVETSYWVRPGGSFSDAPEAGEDLLVQVNNSAGEWVTIDRFAADNASLADGVDRTVYLPGSTVKHDGFQLRFKQVDTDGDGDATGDFWHVDNVQVVGGPRDDGSLRPVLNDVTVSSPGCTDEEDGSGDEDCDDDDDSDSGDEEDGSTGNCIDSPSQCAYTATFGYESTYDAPVFVASGTDANRFVVSDVDGANEQRAGTGPETVSDGPGDDDQPARPERFLPGRHDGTTRVSGFEYERAVTYYLPDDAVTAYGLVTEYGVDVRLNDDTKGSILQGQYLEYGVRINNTGPDGTPDRGPTGETAKIRLNEGITDVSQLTLVTRSGREPVVLDTSRGDDGLRQRFAPDAGVDSATGPGEGAYATYDPETNVVTVGGLPDPGEAVWLNVSTRLPADSHEPITVDAALTYRQTADPETAPADPTPGNDPDSDSETIDPLPINCRGTIHHDGDRLVLTQPLPETDSGGRLARVSTYGTVDTSGDGGTGFSDSGIRLGPYRDVDSDGECEVVYLREGGEEAVVVVMNPDGSDDPKTTVLIEDADFSNTILTTSDRDDDGMDEVYYARNDEQALKYVEVAYSGTPDSGLVQSDGSNVDSDSGVFARADTDGDGSVETFYIESQNEWGVIEDGSTTTRSGGKPFNAGYPQNATGAASLPPGIPYGEGDSGVRAGGPGGDSSGSGLGFITADGADPIEAFDVEGAHAGGRVTLRDSDYDGEYEIVFVGTGGTVRYYNLPEGLTPNYQQGQAVTLVDEEDGSDVDGASGQGVQ